MSLLLLTCIGLSSCNIWDNVFSKFDDPDAELSPRIHAVYKLKQFSILDLAFIFEYDAINEKMKLGFHSHEGTPLLSNSLADIYFAFEDRKFQVSQKNQTLCLEQSIPPELLLNITDMRNIWRYTTFYSGKVTKNGKQLKKYEVSFEELREQMKESTIPDIYIYLNEDRVPEIIEIHLISESLIFEKYEERDMSEDWKINEFEGCTKDLDEFKKKLSDKSDYFGVKNIITEIFKGIWEKFSLPNGN